MIKKFNLSTLVIGEKGLQRDTIITFLESSYHCMDVLSLEEDIFMLLNKYKFNLILISLLSFTENVKDLILNIKKINEDISVIVAYPIDQIINFTPLMSISKIDRFLPFPMNEIDFLNIIHKFYIQQESHRLALENRQTLDEYIDAIDRSFLVSKTNLYGYITHVNDNFCKISGYTREELLGEPHSLVRHPDTDSTIFKDLWETILSKKVWRGRIKNLSKNGKDYIVESVISPVLDQNGYIKEFIAIRQDVTGFVKAGRKVIQKEKEKKEMEKEHYRVMNKTKDEFLVVFTHELKTPLNAIINFSESASKRLEKVDIAKKESLLEMMRVIKENGYDMLETITNILDLSRLKSNKLEFKRDQFTPLELIEGLLSKFDGLITEGEIEIILERDNLDQILVFDKTRVMQIISNLLSNAIKYSRKRVLIYGVLENSQLQLVFEDNGLGIEKKDKIFELYEQEDDGDLKRASKGTGIGLHFVKLLCEGMNIDLSLEDSTSLGGAKFILTFNTKSNT